MKSFPMTSMCLAVSLATLAGPALAQDKPPTLAPPVPGLEIIDRPIRFDAERKELTRDYIRKHYGLEVEEITIVPRAIVIHWTGTHGLKGTWRAFNRIRARRARRHLLRGGAVNVSAHFLVARDGTIYRLMPETWMARHAIGLNYDAIGIENMGGGKKVPLTRKQLKANIALVRYLRAKHMGIRYLIGHMEWRKVQNLPIFRELDPTYRNAKADPGPRFMNDVRRGVRDLGLLGAEQAKKTGETR